MDIFLKRVTPLQEEPQAGASGGVPQEGIIIIVRQTPFVVLQLCIGYSTVTGCTDVSLGAIGYTIQPKCLAGYITWFV